MSDRTIYPLKYIKITLRIGEAYVGLEDQKLKMIQGCCRVGCINTEIPYIQNFLCVHQTMSIQSNLNPSCKSNNRKSRAIPIFSYRNCFKTDPLTWIFKSLNEQSKGPWFTKKSNIEIRRRQLIDISEIVTLLY